MLSCRRFLSLSLLLPYVCFSLQRVYPSNVLTSSTNNVYQKGLGYGFGVKLGVAVSWGVWEMPEVAFRAEWIHPGMKNMRPALSFRALKFSFLFFLAVCAGEWESIPFFFFITAISRLQKNISMHLNSKGCSDRKPCHYSSAQQ